MWVHSAETGSRQRYPIRSGVYGVYWSKPPMNKLSMLRHYGVAAITCGIAVIVARPLKAESSCFLLAIIVSSLFGGRGPGLLAVGLSAIGFDLFFLPSPLPFSNDPSSYLRFGVFLAAAITASQLIDAKKCTEETLRRELEKAMQQREHNGRENRRSSPPASPSPEPTSPPS